VEAAAAEGLRIRAVMETHIHADFVSGAWALARRTGATQYVSGEGAPDGEYAFSDHARVRAIRHGDSFCVGEIRIDAVHTPGHTPEHLTYLVTEERVSSEPLGAFTGDFLLFGDVGRPDIMPDEAASLPAFEAAAHQLYGSLAAFSTRADALLIWPGHRCGRRRSPSTDPSLVTTLGYEKSANWPLTAGDEDAFVERLLADRPDVPRYFGEVKRLNRTGPLFCGEIDHLTRIGPDQVDELVLAYSQFLDVRPEGPRRGLLPGSIAVPLTRDFLTAAGSLLRYHMPIYIVAPDGWHVSAAADALRLIGLDEVRGWVPDAAVEAYAARGRRLEPLIEIGAAQALARQASGALMVDVRTTAEWRAGHMPGATHVPMTRLVDLVRTIDRDTKLVVYSQTGERSRVAGTGLRRIGFAHVVNLAGGFAACLPAETTAPVSTS
jgi:hydroxyacylglutathione hydrolase